MSFKNSRETFIRMIYSISPQQFVWSMFFPSEPFPFHVYVTEFSISLFLALSVGTFCAVSFSLSLYCMCELVSCQKSCLHLDLFLQTYIMVYLQCKIDDTCFCMIASERERKRERFPRDVYNIATIFA